MLLTSIKIDELIPCDFDQALNRIKICALV